MIFRPASLLAPNHSYLMTINQADSIGYGTIDNSFSQFRTGSGPDTKPSVLRLSPPNGTTLAPTNAQVHGSFSIPVRPASVIVLVTQAASAVSGSLSVDLEGASFLWQPSNPLQPNTTYTVTVSGVMDENGNALPVSNTTFTTGASPQLCQQNFTVSPSNNASGVAPNTRIVLTASTSLDPASVSQLPPPITTTSSDDAISGTWSAKGNVATFTPALPYPPGRQIYSYGPFLDLAGCTYTLNNQFTVEAYTPHESTSVLSMFPAAGATGVLPGSQIVLRFSSPVDQTAISNVQVMNGDSAATVGFSLYLSSDQKTVSLSPQMGPNTVITVVVPPSVTDLYGNAVKPFSATFTTGSAPSTPYVAQTHPTTYVPVQPNGPVYLLFSDAVSAVSQASILQDVVMSVNNVEVQATLSFVDAQTLKIVPQEAMPSGSSILILLPDTNQQFQLQTAASASSARQHIAGNTGAAAAKVYATVPDRGVANVGTNASMTLYFDQPIDPTSVSSATINVTTGGQNIACEYVLLGQTQINISPNDLLPGNANITVTWSGLRDAAGNPVAGGSLPFSTGSGVVVAQPQLLNYSPLGVAPTNSRITLTFDRPVALVDFLNGATVSAQYATVPITGRWSASGDHRTMTFVPSQPLPAMSAISVYINNVVDETGNFFPGAFFDPQFTTGLTPSQAAPQISGTSPKAGARDLPRNVRVSVRFTQPIAAPSLSGIRLLQAGQNVPATPALSPDGYTVFLTPAQPLAANTGYTVRVANITSVDGLKLPTAYSLPFTTGAALETAPTTIVAVNPIGTQPTLGPNTPLTAFFSAPIDPNTFTPTVFDVNANGAMVEGAASVSADNLSVSFVPDAGWQPGTTYTVYFGDPAISICDQAGALVDKTGSNFWAFTTPDTLSISMESVSAVSPGPG